MLYITFKTGTGIAIPFHHVLFVQDGKDGGAIVYTDLPTAEAGKLRTFKAIETTRDLVAGLSGEGGANTNTPNRNIFRLRRR